MRYRSRLLQPDSRDLRGGVGNFLLAKADLAQALRDGKAAQQAPKRLGRIIGTDCIDEARACLRRTSEVESGDMRQDNRVCLGVWQSETAEHVSELMVQPGAGYE